MRSSVVDRARRTASILAILGGVVIFAACGGDGATAPVEEIIPTLTVVAGVDSQTAIVAAALPQPIRIKVVNQNALPLVGIDVGWTVTSGAGSVDSVFSVTDSAGVAKTSWVLGTVAGPQTLTATVADGTSLVITAIAQAGTLASLAVVSNAFVSVSAGSTTPALQVRAFDRYGNSVAGAAHTWSTDGGTFSTVSTVSSSAGIAEATLRTDVSPRDYLVTVRFDGGFESSIVVRGN